MQRPARPLIAIVPAQPASSAAPMIVETSPQARYLVPMAIALGFGIILSSVMILVMMPAVHVLVENARQRWRSLLAPVSDDDDRETAPGLHASPNV